MKKQKQDAGGNSGKEIEVTPEMIDAGVRAYSAYDCRFEPCEAAVAKIFLSMQKALPGIGKRVVLAPEVARSLSPYLEPEAKT